MKDQITFRWNIYRRQPWPMKVLIALLLVPVTPVLLFGWLVVGVFLACIYVAMLIAAPEEL